MTIFLSGKLYCHNFLKISSKGSVLSQDKPFLMSAQAGCSHPSRVDKEPGRQRNSIFSSTLRTLTFSSSLVGRWILLGYCPIYSYILAVHFVSFFLLWGDRTTWRTGSSGDILSMPINTLSIQPCCYKVKSSLTTPTAWPLQYTGNTIWKTLCGSHLGHLPLLCDLSCVQISHSTASLYLHLRFIIFLIEWLLSRNNICLLTQQQAFLHCLC